MGALFGRFRKRKKDDQDDDFDPDSTYEIGIDGEVVNGKHTDAELGRIAEQARKDAAKRAKKLAKKRAKQADPEWPNVDVDEVPLPPVQGPQEPGPQDWPGYDVDDYAPKAEQRRPERPERSLPAERDRDPPSSPPVSPPPHREKKREAPRITSTNTGGSPVSSNVTSAPSSSAADTYIQMIDKSTPTTYASTCQEAAAAARHDSTEKEEAAKRLRREAEDFASKPGASNQKAAQDLQAEAAKCEEDARDRIVWAGRLDGMANDAIAKAS